MLAALVSEFEYNELLLISRILLSLTVTRCTSKGATPPRYLNVKVNLVSRCPSLLLL